MKQQQNHRTCVGACLGFLLLAFCAVVLSFHGVAAAQESPTVTAATGNVSTDDFTAQGLVLGNAATEEDLKNAFGKILFDEDLTRWGVPLKKYTFKKDVTVFIERNSGCVAEIVMEKKAIALPRKVKYGATSAYLQQVYGKAARQNLDGAACYVYASPEDPSERLIFSVDHDDGSLLAVRLTMLPLTAEEADAWAVEASEEETDASLPSGAAGQGTIDMSALPQEAEPQLRRATT